jgi:hypothetical protein
VKLISVDNKMICFNIEVQFGFLNTLHYVLALLHRHLTLMLSPRRSESRLAGRHGSPLVGCCRFQQPLLHAWLFYFIEMGAKSFALIY